MTPLESTDVQLLSAACIQREAIERRRRPLTAFFGLVVAFMLLGTESRWPSHGVVRDVLFLTGICLAATGTLGRTWTNLYISGYKSKVLVQEGPYSICRNPLYFFSAVGMIGIGLCSGTLVIPAMMVLFFVAYYPMIISCEEFRLTANHGGAFKEYCLKTPAFWPQFKTYNEPETYIIFPRIMRKRIMDGFWFIALAAFSHIISDLHASNLLPSFFELW